jgi:hypothetical protein
VGREGGYTGCRRRGGHEGKVLYGGAGPAAQASLAASGMGEHRRLEGPTSEKIRLIKKQKGKRWDGRITSTKKSKRKEEGREDNVKKKLDDRWVPLNSI